MKITDRFKIAGKELMRANLGNVVKSLTSTPLNPSSYRGNNGGYWLFGSGGQPDIHFDYTDISSAIKAYTCCPPVTAIINRKAQAFINGKTWILNRQGRAKGKEATGEIAEKLRALMNNPNPLQSWKSFEAQNYIYQQIGGYCVVLPIKPVGLANIYATRLWNVPPWMLEIVEKKVFNLATIQSVKDLIESVTFVCEGSRVDLSLDDIYIFKDFTPSISSLVLPESRIKTLKRPINNIIGALESRSVLIESRGPMYVISSNESDESGNVALKPGEKDDLQKEFQARYGLTRKQSQAIITNANIKVETVGYPTKDLMLFEEIEDNVMTICDNYNYPYRLLSSQKTNSLGGNDVEAYKELLYQDAIIPEAESQYEQWNQFFNLQAHNLILDKDFAHIAALQRNKERHATARYKRNQAALIEFQNNNLTLNQWRLVNDENPVTHPFGDKYYYELVKEGVVFGKGSQLNVSLNSEENNINED